MYDELEEKRAIATAQQQQPCSSKQVTIAECLERKQSYPSKS